MNIQNRKKSFERAVMDQDGIVSYVQQPKLDASGHYRANIDGEMRRVDHLVLLAFVGPCPAFQKGSRGTWFPPWHGC